MIKPRKLNPGDKVAAVSLSWGGPSILPYGVQAEINCEAKIFSIVENAVVD